MFNFCGNFFLGEQWLLMAMELLENLDPVKFSCIIVGSETK